MPFVFFISFCLFYALGADVLDGARVFVCCCCRGAFERRWCCLSKGKSHKKRTMMTKKRNLRRNDIKYARSDNNKMEIEAEKKSGRLFVRIKTLDSCWSVARLACMHITRRVFVVVRLFGLSARRTTQNFCPRIADRISHIYFSSLRDSKQRERAFARWQHIIHAPIAICNRNAKWTGC